ncbi:MULTISPECIES: flagellar biosynthetic protein FliO [Hafnia]|uniref:Flagellar protein n=1 Tax=Hafnia paralvei TaxID=546367 RepID=A0A4Q9EDJ4_9GAMM|nr:MULTISPECIES: flagellar biosynthetic protein FliO [Hafnia]OFS07741.1 flagellar biogenesis protein [Hafnia sp. HMSC23F03]TBM20968.1 flagellar biosynthetic protein FliO [Hafnia paralvei]
MIPATSTATSTPATPVVPAGSVLTQVGSTLGAILLLILIIGWLVKRLGFSPKNSRNNLLNVRASCSLGARERVVVVEVDNQCLVLGVTSQNITHLHTFTAPPSDADPVAKKQDFSQIFKQVVQQQFGKRGDKS